MPALVFGKQTIRHRFLRSWGNPEEQAAVDQDDRAYRYHRLWDLYQGTAFDSVADWAEYRRAFGLYRATRHIWDHVHQLVEFYATHVWSGSLAPDGLTLPDGVPNAVPLADDTDPQLAAAIAQLWMWWNFQEMMTLLVRYTAALGELLVEINDDPARGKVFINPIWPAYVKDVQLDEAGNVKSYVVEYRVRDRKSGTIFDYRREVDSKSFVTYKDGEPFDYTTNPLPGGTQPYGEAVIDGEGEGEPRDDGARIANPYGFAPAVWFRHIRTLGVRGEPAVASTQGALDEANQLFAHLLDKAHVSLEAPIVVAGNIAPNALQRALNSMVGTVKRGFTEDAEGPVSERENLNVLEGPAGTRVETIELKISEATEALDRIIAAIERKCPEITFYSELRSMTQLTGPAAQRLLGDVDRKFRAISGGYDRNLTRLSQMGVSIAAYRLNEGAEGWEAQTPEQEKFRPFAADDPGAAFREGRLNFTIMPRSIVPVTARDRYELLQLKKTVLGDLLPVRQLALEGGYDEAMVDAWERDADGRRQAEMERAAQAQPDVARPRGAPPDGPQRGQERQGRESGAQPTFSSRAAD